jgi:hypothetical protein
MRVEDLKARGYDVDIIHQRWHLDKNGFVTSFSSDGEVTSRGGRTIAVITNHDRTKIYSGVALCSPEDNYCKETGRTIALARAMVQMEELRNKVVDLFVK